MRKKAMAYCRVSTPKQAQIGDSLEDQSGHAETLANNELDADIVPNGRIFAEPFSGRANHRPVLDEAFRYIEEHPGEVDYFIIYEIGRLTRGGSLAYETLKAKLASHGVQLVDTQHVIQKSRNTLSHLGHTYPWSDHSPSEVTETIIASQKKSEVRDLLTRLIGKEIQLTNEGYRTRPPIDGYKNTRVFVNGKKRVVHEIDPERSHFFIAMFEERAKDNFDDQAIVKKINTMGFKTKTINRWSKTKDKIIARSGGNALTVKKLQKYIKNPAYCGIVCEKWTHHIPVRAHGTSLVSIETFNRANKGKVFIKEHEDGTLEIIKNHKAQLRNRNNPFYPYKNLVLCHECRNTFKGSASRGNKGGKYPAYHCNRKHKYIRVPKEEFEQTVKMFVQNIQPSDMLLQALDEALFTVYRRRQKELAHTSVHFDVNIADLKKRKENALETLLETSSAVVKRELEARIDALDAEIHEAQEQREKIEVSEYDISAFIKHAKFLVEHLEYLLLDTGNMERQRALFSLVFEGMPTYQEIFSRTPKLSLMFAIKKAHHEDESLLVSPLEMRLQNTLPCKAHISSFLILFKPFSREGFSLYKSGLIR